MAENFMSAHSILRQEKKRTENLNNNNSNTTITNIIQNNAFENVYGNGVVYYNFDKKKFVKSINGMTKLFIALGTLDSRYDNKKNMEKKNLLHYVHIPLNIPKEKKKTLNKNENVIMIESDVTTENDDKDNKNKKLHTDFTSMKNLIAGDTFLLHSNWIESQQYEVLSVYEKKKENDHNSFDSYRQSKNEKLFISGEINNNKNENFIQIYRDEYTGGEKHQKNTSNSNNLRILEEIEGKNENKNKNKNSVQRNNNAVCVKYMGSIGGLWPTPQVRTCNPIRTYTPLLYVFYFLLFSFLNSFLSRVVLVYFGCYFKSIFSTIYSIVPYFIYYVILSSCLHFHPFTLFALCPLAPFSSISSPPSLLSRLSHPLLSFPFLSSLPSLLSLLPSLLHSPSLLSLLSPLLTFLFSH